MTSAATPAAPPPAALQQHHQHQQQQPHANPPTTPSTPVASQIQAAVSPPSKRDLKSWWKGFKLPSKHQDHHGTAAPFSAILRARPRQKRDPLFAEDADGCVAQLSPAATMLRRIVSEEEKHVVHRASASLSRASPARQPEAPKLGALVCCVPAWRCGRCAREPRSETRPVSTRLIVAEHRSQGIFGVPLRQSITYANVAISLVDEDGKSYIYGYVPIVVAKCGVFLKERGARILCSLPRPGIAPLLWMNTDMQPARSDRSRGHLSS